MNQDAIWYGGRPRPWPHGVGWEPSFPERGTALAQFSAQVYCGQTAGWIKMRLGTEVGLAPPRRHCVRWGSNSSKRAQHPHFSTHVYCGWMDHDATWYGVDLGPGHIVLDRAQLPPERGTAAPPPLSAHLYCGQTVAHLIFAELLYKRSSKKEEDMSSDARVRV